MSTDATSAPVLSGIGVSPGRAAGTVPADAGPRTRARRRRAPRPPTRRRRRRGTHRRRERRRPRAPRDPRAGGVRHEQGGARDHRDDGRRPDAGGHVAGARPVRRPVPRARRVAGRGPGDRPARRDRRVHGRARPRRRRRARPRRRRAHRTPAPGRPGPGAPVRARRARPRAGRHRDPRPGPVVAIVTSEGGPTSHTAILARALGIPAVVGASGAVDLADGTRVLVDGAKGTVVVDPSDEEVASARGARRAASAPSTATVARPTGTPSRCWPTSARPTARRPPPTPARRAWACSAPSSASSTAARRPPSRSRSPPTGRC